MNIIKRYPNRKLYNTSSKQYITLEGIADLIRNGEDVQILDHTSGEDLTALTLTQIIFEQEKKKGGFLPKSVLTGLVQAGGDTLNTLRRRLTVPLDLFHQVDNEIERRMQLLISKGELAKEEGLNLRDKLLFRGGFRRRAPARRAGDADPGLRGFAAAVRRPARARLPVPRPRRHRRAETAPSACMAGTSSS
jgi:polyhydroxyalkanoate synthesis repressor PhaR